MTKILIDSNILVYAFEKDNPEKYFQTQRAIAELNLDFQVFISVQNLAEFSCVCLEKLKKPLTGEEIKEKVKKISTSFQTVSYSEKTVSIALELFDKFDIHFFDALLAATMRENGITQIMTENEKDFKKIPWVKVINPF